MEAVAKINMVDIMTKTPLSYEEFIDNSEMFVKLMRRTLNIIVTELEVLDFIEGLGFVALRELLMIDADVWKGSPSEAVLKCCKHMKYDKNSVGLTLAYCNSFLFNMAMMLACKSDDNEASTSALTGKLISKYLESFKQEPHVFIFPRKLISLLSDEKLPLSQISRISILYFMKACATIANHLAHHTESYNSHAIIQEVICDDNELTKKEPSKFTN
jgi:hypothetical protein